MRAQESHGKNRRQAGGGPGQRLKTSAPNRMPVSAKIISPRATWVR